MGKRSVEKGKISDIVSKAHKENYEKELQRKRDFCASVKIGKVPAGYTSATNKKSDGRMPASFFNLRWVDSRDNIRKAAAGRRDVPRVTSAGRTFSEKRGDLVGR